MAQPTGRISRMARSPVEKLRLMQQAHAQQGSVGLPRVLTRANSAPNLLLERDTASESSLVESSSEGPSVIPVGDADKAPVYKAPAHIGAIQASAPATDAGGKAATQEIMDVHTARIRIFFRQLPAHFSVPNSATRHLLKYGETLVSLEKASPGDLANLLHRVISACNESNEALAYACVEHLLSLGADVNLNEYKDEYFEGAWIRSLDMAVMGKSLTVLRLLLQHGARPDGAFELVDAKGNMNTGIVRALLKAGADPWLSFGRPDQLPSSGEHVSIADFYQQTGMDINAEASVAFYGGGTFSTLELAYGGIHAGTVEQLLDAGAYVGDVIRLKFGWNEEQNLGYYRPAGADAIATYRAQRAYHPCSFAPYALLQSTLQPGPAVAVNTSITTSTSATTTSTSVPVSASGSTLAHAALKPACNALIDGLYSAAAVATLIGSANKMPPTSAQAMLQALALGRVLGHYGAGKGVKASQLDHGIRAALAGAGLWQSYLDCKAQFETLQSDIDRHQADGRTLLTTAASEGKIRMIRLLVKLGARVNYPDAHGDYPLTVAARDRKPDTCSALLSLGANAGTTDLKKRSTLFHVADWLTQTDISDLAGVGVVTGLIEALLRRGYDLRQPTPHDHPDHAACPTVVDLLCKPENGVKLALLGPQRTGTLVQAILSNIDRRGSQPFLNQ